MKKANNGFTLIEVLIALTIMATVSALVFRFVGESSFRISRVDKVQERISFEENVFNSLQDINPLKVQSGSGEIGDQHYEWSAEPISGVFPIRSEDTAQPGYDLQMYKITVNYSLDKGSNRKFSFELIGWHEK
ncbi:type II secretion system protein [Aeromonas veronii]|uniref:Type II secretion system protein n=1 Tax=Aeromonas caviae TaxID=648 RepID=A0ABU5W8R9_AERCA|nr:MULTISPECIES: type II secretion system protein [Aeromonas]ATY81926.1 type II secretion system protein [Aeromonas veronii]MBO0505576.1 type II secretion system protein [Aeromonas veronii]MEA9436198.1 type II secretion system protein [Aeromonas caviae]